LSLPFPALPLSGSLPSSGDHTRTPNGVTRLSRDVTRSTDQRAVPTMSSCGNHCTLEASIVPDDDVSLCFSSAAGPCDHTHHTYHLKHIGPRILSEFDDCNSRHFRSAQGKFIKIRIVIMQSYHRRPTSCTNFEQSIRVPKGKSQASVRHHLWAKLQSERGAALLL